MTNLQLKTPSLCTHIKRPEKRVGTPQWDTRPSYRKKPIHTSGERNHESDIGSCITNTAFTQRVRPMMNKDKEKKQIRSWRIQRRVMYSAIVSSRWGDTSRPRQVGIYIRKKRSVKKN